MAVQAFQVAVRFAALDDAKMEALLLKILKGATASLTWKQLAEVFAVLSGWKLEKVTGLVKLYGHKENPDADEHFEDDDQKVVESRHKTLMPDAVTSLPSSPKINKLYVMSLTEVTPLPARSLYQFRFKPWMGSEGWRVITPSGEKLDFFYEKHDFGDFYHGYKTNLNLSKIPIYRVIPRLTKETSWLADISTKLGAKAPEAYVPRTRESTGSCSVCFQNIKIRGEVIVLHGYKRPGTGQAQGSCEGVNYPAFELSVKGTKHYLEDLLKPRLPKEEDRLKRLKKGEYSTLFLPGDREVNRGEPRWEVELKKAIDDAEASVETLKESVKVYSKLVSNWKERPLPKEGDPHIDWYYKGQT